MIQDKYREDLQVPCYFTDNSYRLRPSSFFDIAQQLAMKGASQLGGSDFVLHERGLGWILVRNAFHFDRLPRVFDDIKLETWHSGVNGPYFSRDYRALSSTGETLVRATSSWVLMDMENRAIVKPDAIVDIFPLEAQCPERALQPDAPKIVIPKDAVREDAGEHVVRYTDIDYNYHANNAKYPAWAVDCLPEEFTTEKTVTDFFINYNREVRLGGTVRFMRARAADGAWFVEGTCEGLQSFICKIVFEDAEAR